MSSFCDVWYLFIVTFFFISHFMPVNISLAGKQVALLKGLSGWSKWCSSSFFGHSSCSITHDGIFDVCRVKLACALSRKSGRVVVWYKYSKHNIFLARCIRNSSLIHLHKNRCRLDLIFSFQLSLHTRSTWIA